MLKQGQILNNRYQIHAVLGEGGFGAVYKVWDDNLQRHCAIKENLQVTPESQKQFKREAIMLANLNHPHLVRVTDYFIFPNQGQYLVMDFVDGDDLQTILTNNGGPLPSEQALAWIRQVCDALIYIHNQNPPIIHRDIKPANIRITPQENAVLVDFGLAKTFDVGAKTSMGARGLTPHFAAPEQYGTGGTDAQSDIYSLGVTLYCLLTYSVPPDSVEIVLGNANPPPPAKAVNRNIPDAISDALQCAMQLRRTDRYKLVSDFKGALEGKQKTLAHAKAEPVAIASINLVHTSSVSDILDKVESLEKNGCYEDAINCLNQGLKIAPGNLIFLNNKAFCLYHLGRYEEAIRCCDQAFEIDPHNIASLIKVDALESLGRYEEAIRCLDKALEFDPRNTNLMKQKGNRLLDLGRYEEAIRCYDKALEIDPRNVDALSNKGYSLNGWGRYEQAIRCYDKVLEIDASNVDAIINRAYSLKNLGRIEEAIRHYDKTLEIDPRNVIALNEKAYYGLEMQGRSEEAIGYYDKALEIDPRNVDTLVNKGHSLSMLDRHEEAIRCYDKALEIDPRNVYTLNVKAESLDGLSRYEEAIHYCDQALENNPRDVDALFNKGNSLENLGRYEEAIRHYDMALEIDPRNVYVLKNKADSLDSLGQYEEALLYYDKALEIDPRYVYALERKAYSLKKLGR